MAGIPGPVLSPGAIKTLLEIALQRLHLELTSPPRVPVGQPVTASIKGLGVELDVSDLLEGVVDAGWVGYLGAQIVNTADDASHVDDLKNAIKGLTSPAGARSAIPITATDLLGRVIGLAQIPRLRIRVDVEWHLSDDKGHELIAGSDFLAPNGLTQPDVSLLIPPLFQELTLDTLEGKTINYCSYKLSARVTLSIGSVWASIDLPSQPPYVTSPSIVSGQLGDAPPAPKLEAGIPIVALPLLYPTLLALFSAPGCNLSMPGDGKAPMRLLIVVPHNSPISSLEQLNRVLKKVDQQVADLRDLASVASALLGIDLLNQALDALSNQPAARLVTAESVHADPLYPDGFPTVPLLPWDQAYPQGVADFSQIVYWVNQNRLAGIIPIGETRITFNDVARSLVMLGLPGIKATFFNHNRYSNDEGTWYIGVPQVIDSGNPLALLPFVIVRNIPALITDPDDIDWDKSGGAPVPDTIPPGRASIIIGFTDGWGNKMSSLLFSQPGLTLTCSGVLVPPSQLSLECQQNGNVEVPFSVSGQLFPAFANQTITLVYKAPSGDVVTHKVTTDALGRFSDKVTPHWSGEWSIAASWPGDQEFASAAASCAVDVQPIG